MTGVYGPITQIAWVTRDIAATEAFLSQVSGAGRWSRMPDIAFGETCQYRSAPADFTAHISLSYIGDMQLELIEPRSGASIYTEFLDRSGPGLHHICFEPPDFDVAITDAQHRGVDIPLSGNMGGAIRFAYLDGASAGVPYIELAEISSDMRAMYEQIKQRSRA